MEEREVYEEERDYMEQVRGVMRYKVGMEGDGNLRSRTITGREKER